MTVDPRIRRHPDDFTVTVLDYRRPATPPCQHCFCSPEATTATPSAVRCCRCGELLWIVTEMDR